VAPPSRTARAGLDFDAIGVALSRNPRSTPNRKVSGEIKLHYGSHFFASEILGNNLATLSSENRIKPWGRVQESTRQTNKIGIYSQTVDLDVAGSNPVTHPKLQFSKHRIFQTEARCRRWGVRQQSYRLPIPGERR